MESRAVNVVSEMQTVSVTREITPKDNVCVFPQRRREIPRNLFMHYDAGKSRHDGQRTLDSRELLNQIWRQDRAELLQNVADWHVQPRDRLHQTHDSHLLQISFTAQRVTILSTTTISSTYKLKIFFLKVGRSTYISD